MKVSARLQSGIGSTSFDIVIIGGGIIGAGIARDASMRGLRVALFERNDFGAGTTSGSTRLIHGGLRYLEMLDFRLVRMDLRERETLLRIAPHLVAPLEFLLPFYSRSLFYRLKLRLGMILYDLLSFDKSLPGRGFLSAEELLRLEPHLRAENLQGACSFYDAQVNSPERLCLENVLSARDHGASVFNHTEVTAGLPRPGGIEGVAVRDLLDGGEMQVRGRIVINAAGPWVDRVAPLLTREWTPRVRTTKGIHIACPPLCSHAMALASPVDGRLFFAIPWLGHTWVGTTDTDYPGDPGSVRADGAEVRYLLESAGAYLPEIGSILFTNAGVRALVGEKGDESTISRMHKVLDGQRHGTAGLITVLGGKITGYRAIAEEVTDLACRRLGVRRPCLTGSSPLPGAEGTFKPPAFASRKTVDHLKGLYGTRASLVFEIASSDPALLEPLALQYPDIAAQVVFAVRREQCLTVSDFMERRTIVSFSPDQGWAALPAVVSWMSRELGWTADRQSSEMQNYERKIRQTQQYAQDLHRTGTPN